jgi:hypothetical protein
MKFMGLPFKIASIVVAAVALLALGYFIGSKERTELAEARDRGALACHPEGGDLAQDGNMFAALSPDRMAVTISTFNSDKKPFVIKLSRPANDIVMLGNKDLLLSYGSLGEVALLNVESGQQEAPLKVGEFAGAMCKTAAAQALISDSAAEKVYQFDFATKRIIQTYPIDGKPVHLKWATPEVELAVLDAKGRVLDTINPVAKPAPPAVKQ